MMAGLLFARAGVRSGCSKSTPTSSAISAATRSTPRPWKSSTSSACSDASSNARTTASTRPRSASPGGLWTIGDLSHLETPAPFIAMMPQWEFLDFLRDEAAAFPGFHLEMEAPVEDFIEKDGRDHRRENGRRARSCVRKLTIAADGRSSMVRGSASGRRPRRADGRVLVPPRQGQATSEALARQSSSAGACW